MVAPMSTNYTTMLHSECLWSSHMWLMCDFLSIILARVHNTNGIYQLCTLDIGVGNIDMQGITV